MKLIILLFSFYTFSFAYASPWKEVFNKDDVKIFAKKTNQKIIPFKAVSIIDSNIENVLNVLTNINKKHTWAPKLKKTKIHKLEPNGVIVYSEYYQTPWPATDREFLLKGFVDKKSATKYILRAKSIESDKFKNKDHIQCEVSTIEVSIESLSTKKTKITFIFEGDMKGWMPVWLMNIIQKKWPYRFILALKKQIRSQVN